MSVQSTVSIAMCTYNAERFLEEQLESFLRQSVLPSELVVQDDGSSDETLQALEGFAIRARFPVRIEQNPTNLGPTGNFEKAMGRCRGEVVMLSDADDIWHPDRIRAAVELLAADRSLGCVFSDAELMNEDGSTQGHTLWESIGFGPQQRAAFARGELRDALFRRTIGFGGTMAFRRSLLDVVLPIPRRWGHDNWTALIAAAMSEVAILDRCLIRYRQHASQYSGGGSSSPWRKLRAGPTPRRECDWIPRAGSFTKLAERLRAQRSRAPSPGRLSDFIRFAEEKDRHLTRRQGLPAKFVQRIPPIVVDACQLRYHRYSNGMSSVIRDLVFGRY